ncbi:MAG: hypothetical protein HY216_09090 [Candidatus Rokubacteria bacterium]|nr:hypothetical protein [Candidatus Rokubacteria bacterium]
MKDTTPAVEHKYRALLLQRSGAERLAMGSSMHSTAAALVRASVLAQHPHASPATIRRELFLRFYAHEFDANARRVILEALQ